MDESPPPISAAVTVSEASDDQRQLWAQAVSYALEGSGSLADANTAIAWPNANKTSTRCFIAWIGGEPAGGGALAMHDGVAICFSTSIHPIFRRMGAQTALLHARLHAARRAGCDLALVQTTPGGASQRNVEKAGFHLAYTRVTLIR
jgi:GNAT superfamily N-acetyltransferase